ncbi:MAG: nuclear transport factor 2 family protein [Thermomicrobiales bacterium]
MSQIQELIDRYASSWNETDAARRRRLIEQVWTPDGHYLDPLMSADGIDGIDAMIVGIQQHLPGLVMRRVGDIDAHHDRVRFTWELAAPDGQPVAGGLDIGTLADGRLRSIVGFIDFAPGV